MYWCDIRQLHYHLDNNNMCMHCCDVSHVLVKKANIRFVAVFYISLFSFFASRRQTTVYSNTFFDILPPFVCILRNLKTLFSLPDWVFMSSARGLRPVSLLTAQKQSQEAQLHPHINMNRAGGAGRAGGEVLIRFLWNTADYTTLILTAACSILMSWQKTSNTIFSSKLELTWTCRKTGWNRIHSSFYN